MWQNVDNYYGRNFGSHMAPAERLSTVSSPFVITNQPKSQFLFHKNLLPWDFTQWLCLQAMKKARLSRILRVIQVLLKTLLVHFGYWVQLHEVVNSELKPIVTVTHIFCILFWLFIIFSFQPGFILCSQMTCNLMKSSEEIFLDDIRTKVILKNTLRFIKRTKRTSKLLSPIYFHLLLCALEPLTFRIYQLIDFGFSQSPHHVLLYVGIVTDILGCGLTHLWILNTQSEDLKQQFKSIIVMRKLSKKSITDWKINHHFKGQ